MGNGGFIYDKTRQEFRKVTHSIWHFVRMGLKYLVLTLTLSILYYGVFSLFISTDTEWLNEVAPSPGYFITMTPLIEWFGNVLGVPIQEQEMVDMATADYVADDLHKCFE